MPTRPPHGIEIHQHNAASARTVLDQLGDVYADARAEPPYDADPRWHRDAFHTRTSRQVANPEFLLVTAESVDRIVGFAFGQPMAPGQWYEGDTEPPAEILAATKFSVTELNVARSWRNQGVGRALLSELLLERPERYAILSSLPGTVAHGLYQRLGWCTVAHTKPDGGLPPWDTLAISLMHRHRGDGGAGQPSSVGPPPAT